MKKKLLIIAMSLCMVLTCMPQTLGTAFAAETGNDMTVTEQQTTAAAEGHDCGYHRPEGICVPITELPDEQPYRIAAQNADSEQTASKPISGDSLEEEERIGKKYYLRKLSKADSLIVVYEKIANAIDCHEESVEFAVGEDIEITSEEADMVYYLVKEDYPEFFWWGNGNPTYYVYKESGNIAKIELVGTEPDSEGETTNVYTFDTRDEIVAAKAKFDAKVDEIVAQTASLSEYESELFFHDWIALNNYYDNTFSKPHNHDAYGAIVDGVAVCEGYTRAMQVLLNKADITNYTVSGTSRNSDGEPVGHTWNVVQLDDGNWYQVDATWDDQGDKESDIFYAYFNITTEQMKKDHTIPGKEDEDFPNYVTYECNATKYWYYTQNPGFVVTVEETIDEADFIEKLEEQFKETKVYARIYALNDNSANKKLWKLFANSSAIKVLQNREFEGSFSRGFSSMGEIEYHFELRECKDVYGILEQGKKNLKGITIRFYPCDADDEEIENSIKLELPDEKGAAQEGRDNLCDGEAEFCDTEWQDCNDSKNEYYVGTFAKRFFAYLPENQYKMAVYLSAEGYGGCSISYVSVGEEATTLEKADENKLVIYDLGDLDDNCIVDASDAIFLQRYIAKWPNYRENGNWYAADINNDGKVDSADLMILQRHLAGWKDFKNLEDYENGNKTLTDTQNAA